MMKLICTLLVLVFATSALVGCRAEVDTDTQSSVPAAR